MKINMFTCLYGVWILHECCFCSFVHVSFVYMSVLQNSFHQGFLFVENKANEQEAMA